MILHNSILNVHLTVKIIKSIGKKGNNKKKSESLFCYHEDLSLKKLFLGSYSGKNRGTINLYFHHLNKILQ